MNKLTALFLALLLTLALAACGSSAPPESSGPASSSQPAPGSGSDAPALIPITVAASTTPHAEILAAAKETLAAEGYDLQVTEFADYIQPNLVVEGGDLLANYFQHQPYLDDFNAEQGTHLVSIAQIHYEAMGIYPGKTAALVDLPDNAKVAVPNDTTNEARALLLLESQGLIKLNPEAGIAATKKDIIENPKNLDIIELEAAQLARTLPDVDIAVINGNYALQAGLNAATDALAKEEKDSLAAETYANVLVVKEGAENEPAIVALAAALQSDAVRAFIDEKYQGAVVALF